MFKVIQKAGKKSLTIFGHSNIQTFSKSTILTTVSIKSNNQALLISQTFIVNLLLYTSPEETL